MKKAGILKKISILVIVLALPGFLYYLLTSQGKNRYKPLAYFGPKQVAKTTHKVKGKDIPDTLYHTIPDFTLTDQDGKDFTFKAQDKKIYVVNFFYTNCPTVCNLMNRNISFLDSTYAKNKMIYFLTISVDPKRDDVMALKKYAAQFKYLSPKWKFLMGDTSMVYNLAKKGFLVNAVQTGTNDFIYSDKIILVDSDKHIRGYYNAASTPEAGRLDDEIKVLISDELRRHDTPLY